jgi:hypothetical protein
MQPHFRRDDPDDMVNIVRVQPRKRKDSASQALKGLVSDLSTSIMGLVQGPPPNYFQGQPLQQQQQQQQQEPNAPSLSPMQEIPMHLLSGRPDMSVPFTNGGGSFSRWDSSGPGDMALGRGNSWSGSGRHEVMMDVTRQLSGDSVKELVRLIGEHGNDDDEEEEDLSYEEPPERRGLALFPSVSTGSIQDKGTDPEGPLNQQRVDDLLGEPPAAPLSFGDMTFGTMSRFIMALSQSGSFREGEMDGTAGGGGSFRRVAGEVEPPQGLNPDEEDMQESFRGIKRGLSERTNAPVEIIDKNLLDRNDLTGNAVHVFMDGPVPPPDRKRQVLAQIDAGELPLLDELTIANVSFAPERNALFVTLASSSSSSPADHLPPGTLPVLGGSGFSKESSSITSNSGDASFLSRLMKIPLDSAMASQFTPAWGPDDTDTASAPARNRKDGGL